MTTEARKQVADAVKDLRLRLGETQEVFARRMGTAVRTVARWETVRPPMTPGILNVLLETADQKGWQDLAAVFNDAAARQYQEMFPNGLPGYVFSKKNRAFLRYLDLLRDEQGALKQDKDHAVLSELLADPEKYADELGAWRLIRRQVQMKRGKLGEVHP